MQPVNNHGTYNKMAGLDLNGISGAGRLVRSQSVQPIGNSQVSQAVSPQGQGVALPGKENFIVPENQRVDKLSDVFDDKTLKQIGAIECQTCASRTYQDGSNDPGVSFKSPQHISPEMSGAIVMSHEMEHVVNEQAKAESEDRQVISQSVQIHTDSCPECGKSYVSGGVTKTTTGAKSEAYSSINESNAQGNLLDITL